MGLVRPVGITLLTGVVVLAHLALSKQAKDNDFIVLEKVFTFKQTYLSGTKIPIKIPSFGHDNINSYFTFMMHFFWSALDPQNVRAHLHANHILGAIGGGFLLQLIEAHRGVSTTTFVFLTYFLELLGEFLGIGQSTPIWCVAHLILTAVPSAKGNARENLSAPRGNLQALGYAFVLGHVAPTALLALTKIDADGLASQQFWTIARLFHPVFVGVLYNVFKTLQRANAPPAATTAAVVSTPEQRLSSTRKYYTFAIVFSAYFHVTTMSVLLAQRWIPNWLRADILAQVDVYRILVPTPFWIVQKGLETKEGVAIFLQWDDLCTSLALVVWGATLYVEALKGAGRGYHGVFNTFAQATLVGVFAGPAAASAFFLSERDGLILAAATVKESEKKAIKS